MKAKMDSDGVVTLIAETPMEAYAISCWHKECAQMIGEEKHPLIDEDISYDEDIGYDEDCD